MLDKNGGRYARVATIFAFINITILVVVLGILVGVWLLIQRNNDLPNLNVFSADSPQEVTELSVPPDGAVHVTTKKCNLISETLAVDGNTYLVQETPVRRRWLRTETVGAVWVPGCVTAIFENKLQVGLHQDEVLTPGMYHFEGTNTIRYNAQRQDVPWYTESFEIVP